MEIKKEKKKDDWLDEDFLEERKAHGKELIKLGNKNPNILSLEADLKSSTIEFGEKYPDRLIDFGVAEANMISFAAGLATVGKIPYVHTMAAFASMRACEQIRVDLAYNNTNVKIVATYAGISGGAAGTTHHAIEDIAIMRSMPNMTVIIPADSIETRKVTNAIAEIYGPVYVRLGRGATPLVYKKDYNYKIGKAIILNEGSDVTIFACGSMIVPEVIKAAKLLLKKGIEARVVNMHTIKPLDEEVIIESAIKTKYIVTVEEHNIIGGLGSAVSEVLVREYPTFVNMIGFKDKYVEIIASYNELLEYYGLTSKSIAKNVEDFLMKHK
jgi:transketolase